MGGMVNLAKKSSFFIVLFVLYLLLAQAVIAQQDIISELLSTGEDLKGTELPSALGALFGNERINLHVRLNSGEEVVLGLTIENKVIQGIQEGELDDPTMNTYVGEDAINEIMDSDDPTSSLMDALDNREITYRGVGFFNWLKYVIVSIISKIVSLFTGS